MKLYLLFFQFFFTSLLSLQSQTYCQPILDKAVSYYNSKLLDLSLLELQKAGDCDYTNSLLEDRKTLINNIYNAIVKQKIQAEKDRGDAILNADRAQKSSIEAIAAAQLAKLNEEIAIRARDSIAQQKLIAERNAILAESSRLAQLAGIVAESGDTPSDAFCLAYKALALGWDTLTQNQSYGAFGDALYEFSGLKKTIQTNKKGTTFNDLKFIPNHKLILTVNSNNLIQLWDLNGTSLTTLPINTDFILDVVVAPNGEFVVICNDNGSIVIWDLKSSITPLQHHRKEVLGCVFHPTQQQFLTWSRDSTAILWSLKGGALDTFYHDSYVYQAEFSNDGEQLITRTANNSFTQWTLNPKKKVNIRKHNSYIHHILFHPTKHQILSCSSDSTAIIWNEQDSILLKFPTKVVKGSFSPDGNLLATQTKDTILQIWNTENGTLIKTILHKGIVSDHIFSSDGSFLVTGSKGEDAYLWHISQDSIIDIKGDTTAIINIFISEDNRYIITQTIQKIIVWNKSGVRLMTLNHQGKLSALMTNSSSHIISSLDSQTLEITPNPLKEFLAYYNKKESPCEGMSLTKKSSYKLSTIRE